MLLASVAVAEGEDAGLAAAQERAEQLGDAGGLDLPADGELVASSGRGSDSGGGHRARLLRPVQQNAFSQSMGSGKMMVEFFSAAISVRVCR